MKTEIEAKFLNVDHHTIRRRLESLGATLEQPMRLMRRVIIETPELKAKGGFVRIRDEGHKVSLTYKQFDELSITGAKELEVTVSDFDETIKLFAAAGLTHGSFQESMRETWKYGDTEVVLDVWPWLNPYIEIEAASEQEVESTAEALGLEWGSAVFGDVMTAYKHQYPHLGEHDTVGNLTRVAFDDDLPDLFIPSTSPTRKH